MADRELIAAILTAGMLATLPIPRSRGPVTDAEGETIQTVAELPTEFVNMASGKGDDWLAVDLTLSF